MKFGSGLRDDKNCFSPDPMKEEVVLQDLLLDEGLEMSRRRNYARRCCGAQRSDFANAGTQSVLPDHKLELRSSSSASTR